MNEQLKALKRKEKGNGKKIALSPLPQAQSQKKKVWALTGTDGSVGRRDF